MEATCPRRPRPLRRRCSRPHGTSDQRKLFKQLTKAFQSEEPPQGVLERLLPPATCQALDKALAAYVKTLR